MMLIDMGHKSEMGSQPTEAKQEVKISYPGFSMTGDQIPEELGNMKNGEKCHLDIIVRKIGDNIDTYAKGEPRRIEVEIHKLGYEGSKVSEDEYKNMSDEDKDKEDEKEVMDKE